MPLGFTPLESLVQAPEHMSGAAPPRAWGEESDRFRDGPGRGKSEQSPQGATFLPGVHSQFPWKLGQNPRNKETNMAGFRFSFRKDESYLPGGGE